MSLVLTQEGAIAMWGQLVGSYTIGPPLVRLFGRNHAPLHTDTLAILAGFELSVGGYAPLGFGKPVGWQLSPLPNGAQALSVVLQWSFTDICTVWGYFVTTADKQFSLFAEAFANSFSIGSGGGPFSLQLPLALTSQP